ncbi:hypothetical protein P9X10_02635 [Bacillus cereus]|nr:hypothetical protein [Bacillus cereus]
MKKSIDYWFPVLAGGVMGLFVGDMLFSSNWIGVLWGMIIGLAFIPSTQKKDNKQEDTEETVEE